MSTTTLKGVGTGSSCTVTTNDPDLISFLDSLPERGYATEWAVRSGYLPDGAVCFEVSAESALTDPVQTAVKGAPIPAAPVGGRTRPRDVELARLRASSPRS